MQYHNINVFGYETKYFSQVAKQQFESAIQKVEEWKDLPDYLHYKRALEKLANFIDKALDPAKEMSSEQAHELLQNIGIYNYKSGMHIETGFVNKELAERKLANGGLIKKYRVIKVSGFTNKNTEALWGGSKIETHTSFNAEDFDFGNDAEKELTKCKEYIKQKEVKEDWIPGSVTCFIDEIEIEEDIEYKKGGVIKDQYAGKKPEEIWQELTHSQKDHFLKDHHLSPRIKGLNLTATEMADMPAKKFFDLPTAIQEEFTIHVQDGQYAKGGTIPSGPFYVSIKPLREGGETVYTRISPDQVDDFVAGYVVYKSPTSNKQAGYLTKDQLEFMIKRGDYTIVPKEELNKTTTGNLPVIVSRAVLNPVTDIGQLSKVQKRELDKYVKKGLLVKGKGGPYPKEKTVYAIQGFDIKKDREDSIRKMLDEVEQLQPDPRKHYKAKGGLIGYMEDNAEKIIHHYLPRHPADEILPSDQFTTPGQYKVDNDTARDGSKKVFIEVYFGDQFNAANTKLDTGYNAYSRFLVNLANNKGYDAEIMTIPEKEIVSFHLTKPKVTKAKGGIKMKSVTPPPADQVTYKKHVPGSKKRGGRVGFKDKSDAIADSLLGTNVSKKYQKEYGKTYNKKDARKAADKIAGSLLKKENAK